MCGRYSFDTEIDALITAYKLRVQEIEYERKSEIRPTDVAPILFSDGNLRLLRWGFTPSFTKSPLINARGETVTEKKTFRDAFARRRCVVPSSGFYEWGMEGELKKKYHFTNADSPILSMAGLWEMFPDAEGNEQPRFTILTTAATDQMQQTHDRMPVILNGTDIYRYLNHTTYTNEDFKELLKQTSTRLVRKEAI